MVPTGRPACPGPAARQGWAETVRLLTTPPPELELNGQSLRGHRLTDLVIGFSGLTVHADAYHLGCYYRVRYRIHDPSDTKPRLWYWSEAEYSSAGEFRDEFFGHG